MDDAKQYAFFVQLLDRTGLHSALGRTTLGALAGVDAIAAIAAQFPRDGAGRASKGSCNISHGKLLKMKMGQGHAFFWLDLLIVLELGNLQLWTLQG
jgi:hypothetical protein